jgi:hypothetical protein
MMYVPLLGSARQSIFFERPQKLVGDSFQQSMSVCALAPLFARRFVFPRLLQTVLSREHSRRALLDRLSKEADTGRESKMLIEA